MRRFFHCCPAERDPGELLDPERQFTEPWGGPDHGPCEKCGGGGTTGYECCSCLEGGADPECPACQGRARFRATCPSCEGSGEVTRTRRRGIAVFPTRPGLYRYLADRDAELEARPWSSSRRDSATISTSTPTPAPCSPTRSGSSR